MFNTATKSTTWRHIALSSWSTIHEAAIYGWMDIDAEAALAAIDEVRHHTGVRLTLTHLVGKAAAAAFTAVPQVNAIASLGRIRDRSDVSIFFSVDVGKGKNLSGTKIENVDRKSVLELAREMSDKVDRVRSGNDVEMQNTQSTLKRIPPLVLRHALRAVGHAMYDFDLDLRRFGVEPDPFGSAIVTNIGALGLEQGFAPLFDHGRTAAMLAVGKVRDKAIVRDGQVVVRPTLTVCATFDHRVFDGITLARFSQRLTEVLENPTDELDLPRLRSAHQQESGSAMLPA